MSRFIEGEWRVIPGFPNYELSHSGVARNVKTGQVLTKRYTDPKRRTGQKYVLRKDGKAYQKGLNKLMDATFPDM